MTGASDQLQAEPRDSGDSIRLGALAPGAVRAAAAVGVVLLLTSIALGAREGDGFRRLSEAYLVAFLLALSVGLGALCWVTLQHLGDARWSVPVRRGGELLASSMPALAVLSLPVVVPALLGVTPLFPWLVGAPAEPVPGSAAGRPYLTRDLFGARWLLSFGFWSAAATWMLRRSLAQDAAGGRLPLAAVRRWSPLLMIGIVLTTTFAAVDYLMSLDPTWHSAVFGLYFLCGCMTAGVSAVVLSIALLHRCGRLRRTVTTRHLHELGRTLFVCVLGWAYLAFSQYLLIWYAGLPAETAHHAVRARGGWQGIAFGLALGHFLLPFLGLLSRRAKGHPVALPLWAGWLLVMHLLDLYYLAMPALDPLAAPFHPLDLTCALGVGALLLAQVAHCARRCDLVPTGDPRLRAPLAPPPP